MKYLLLLAVLMLSACVTGPEIIKGKGAVYGQLFADSHPLFNKKLESHQNPGSIYDEMKTAGVNYQDNMVNYAKLDELYVGLIQPNLPPRQHYVDVNKDGMSPRSIALALGDTIVLHNNTHQPQTFFLAETSTTDGKVQAFPVLAAGATARFIVELEGALELLSEENEAFKTAVFSKKDILTQRVSSGGNYQFDNLEPGSYPLIFWYWRLGKTQQTIQIRAEENLRVDKTLTVDSVIKPY